jgi:GGDEF domain-containing protein
MTTRKPDLRAKELSEGSGVPAPFVVAYAREVSNCEGAEAIIHDKLKTYRVTRTRHDRNREFFNLPLHQAIKIVEEIIEKLEPETDSLTDIYAVMIFALDDDFDALENQIGSECLNKLVKIILNHVYKYFKPYGAFSSRECINEISVLISGCDKEKAQNILNNFTTHFKERIIPNIKSNIRIEKPHEMVKIDLLAGLAQGKPAIEIEAVKEFARFQSVPIIRIVL